MIEGAINVDLTNATFPELKARKKEVEDLISSGQVSTQLIDERNMLSNRIAELSGNEVDEEEEETDQVIVRANEEIALFGVPFGAYISDTADHISLRTVVLAKVKQLMQDNEALKATYESELESKKNDIAELMAQIDDRDKQISELKSAKYDAELESESNAKKRDNAYNELLEAKQTIDELNDKLAAATAPKDTIITNLGGAAPVKKKKREIYDVEYIGRRNEKFTAKFADTDESFEDYSVFKDNKYTEVTPAEAETFRTSYLEQHPAPVVEEEVQVEPTAPAVESQFRDEDTTESGLAEEAPAVVGSFITEERIASIEERLAKAEQALRSAGALA